MLRSGASDERLVDSLRLALAGKTEHAFSSATHGDAPKVIMTGIGG